MRAHYQTYPMSALHVTSWGSILESVSKLVQLNIVVYCLAFMLHTVEILK